MATMNTCMHFLCGTICAFTKKVHTSLLQARTYFPDAGLSFYFRLARRQPRTDMMQCPFVQARNFLTCCRNEMGYSAKFGISTRKGRSQKLDPRVPSASVRCSQSYHFAHVPYPINSENFIEMSKTCGVILF